MSRLPRKHRKSLDSRTHVARLARVIACAMGCSVGSFAFGDEADWQYPAPLRTFEIEGGLRIFPDDSQDDDSYYRAVYRGSLIDSSGTPFKSAEHFEITEPAPTAASGDRNDLFLRIEKGHAEIGGDLLEADGAMPLPLRGLTHLGLRGAAYVATDLDGDRVKAATGLESPPLRLPFLGSSGVSNWLVFGVMAERNDATDSVTEDDTYGLLTGRFFVGSAFGWRKSADVQATAAKMEKLILEKAPDLDKARALVTEIREIPPNQLTALQALIIDTAGEAEDGADWNALVRGMAVGAADAITDQPTLAVYLEGSGWYAGSSLQNEPKHRGLLSLTVDYWPLESRDDVLLRAEYERGFERLMPNLRINQVTATVVVQF